MLCNSGMFFSRYFKASRNCRENKRHKPKRCRAAATSGSSKTSIRTASSASTKAGKPIRVCPPFRISSSSGNSPNDHWVYLASAVKALAVGLLVFEGDGATSVAATGAATSSLAVGAGRALSPAKAWKAPRACEPHSALSPPRLRPCPNWRPCSSTTLKFMNKCAATMSCLKSARFMSSWVCDFTWRIRASTKEPPPNISGADKASAILSAVSGKGTKRARGFWGKLFSKA